MRNSVFRLLLPMVLGLSAACTEQTTEPESSQVPATPAPQPGPPAMVAAIPAADTTEVQNLAAYLAGQPVSQTSNLRPLTALPIWQAFAADQAKNWTKYHQTRTEQVQSWAASELDSVRRSSPIVFYPFSGPDLLNVVTMFPTSQTYVLIGLEPVGTLPARRTLENPKLFPAIKASLWSVLSFSFFRTNDMAVDLKSLELDGALPLLLLFAVRTNHQVQAVRYVKLDAQGQLTETDTATIRQPSSKIIPGVELTMRNAQGQEQWAYYFSADLSDWKLNTTKEATLRYVRSLGPLTTYVKSATYLMHKAYFSKVRSLALTRSNFVLQDDSGIAMKYFRPAD